MTKETFFLSSNSVNRATILKPVDARYGLTYNRPYLVLFEGEALQFRRQAVGNHFRKEVIDMPITLTLHVFGYTITIRVMRKSNDRHLAK